MDHNERPPPLRPRPSVTFVTFKAQSNLQSSSSKQQQQVSNDPRQQAEAYDVIDDSCNSNALYSSEDHTRQNDVISVEPEVQMAMINERRSLAQWLRVAKLQIKQKQLTITSMAILIVVVAGFIVLDLRYRAGFVNLTLTTTTPLSANKITSRTSDVFTQQVVSNSDEYMGFVSMTSSGRVCQAWNKTQPHYHSNKDGDFPDGKTSAAKNYCRDPSRSGVLWCFTTDPGMRWDTCFTIEWEGPHVDLCASVTCPQGTLCQQVNNTHHTCVCEVQALGSYKYETYKCQEPRTYRGHASVASSGEPCLPWTFGSEQYSSDTFIDGSRNEAGNYCRAVDYYKSYLSCYTASSKLAYSPCAVDLCGVVKDPCRANGRL